MIHLSDRALIEIDRRRTKQTPTPPYFRLNVLNQGCAGLSYDLKFEAVKQEQDQSCAIADLAILIDPQSLAYVQGLTIDYTEDLMGGGFQFTNPQAVKTCDCGISFAISVDNTQEWTVDCGL
jgi:iron-sulfur cluster assembly protein